jgi:carbamoyl-phosphate synthase large subunit
MKSTGEVMGVGVSFGEAFHKAVLGSNEKLPTGGRAFISVRDTDKSHLVSIGRT